MTQRDEGHDFRDSKNKAQAYERQKKYPVIIDMVIRWLDTNINDLYNDELDSYSDSPYKKYLANDSADLKEKIKLALDPETTKRQIEDGDF